MEVWITASRPMPLLPHHITQTCTGMHGHAHRHKHRHRKRVSGERLTGMNARQARGAAGSPAHTLLHRHALVFSGLFIEHVPAHMHTAHVHTQDRTGQDRTGQDRTEMGE